MLMNKNNKIKLIIENFLYYGLYIGNIKNTIKNFDPKVDNKDFLPDKTILNRKFEILENYVEEVDKYFRETIIEPSNNCKSYIFSIFWLNS